MCSIGSNAMCTAKCPPNLAPISLPVYDKHFFHWLCLSTNRQIKNETLF